MMRGKRYLSMVKAVTLRGYHFPSDVFLPPDDYVFIYIFIPFQDI